MLPVPLCGDSVWTVTRRAVNMVVSRVWRVQYLCVPSRGLLCGSSHSLWSGTVVVHTSLYILNHTGNYTQPFFKIIDMLWWKERERERAEREREREQRERERERERREALCFL